MSRTALVLLFLALTPLPARAAGLLLPRRGGAPIAIESHRVQASVTDGLAVTTIRQTFVNQHPRVLEAIYVFPLPENAALTGVAMEVGGQRLEGLLAERKRARKVYDGIVREKRDPALVEQIGRGKFRLSVFPVLPNQPTVVEITYTEYVPLSRGVFRYVYPLALGGGAATTLKDLTVSVILRSSAPLTEVTTDVDDAEVIRRGNGTAIVSLERPGGKLDRDLTVTAKVEAPEATLSFRTWRASEGDGYFTAVLTPPPLPPEKLLARDVILVLDTSGSMNGDGKIEQAKAAAIHLLSGLRKKDRVNILRFSSEVVPFANAPVPVTDENLAKLTAFIDEIRAAGSTALGDALREATGLAPDPGRVQTIVLLTDGMPTIGITEPASIAAIAKGGGEKGLRVFPFGVGPDVHSGLLRGIARATGGTAEVFRPGGEVITRLRSFLDRTNSPAVTEVKVTAMGVRLYDVFPRPLPVTCLGEQVVISGRYRGGGTGKVILTAVMGDEPLTLTTDHAFPVEAGGDAAVGPLYARQKLDFLEGELRLRSGLGDKAYFAALDAGAYSTGDEIVSEIIEVSLAHGVQCAYTSFIALLPEDRARIDPRDADAIAKALQRAQEARGIKPKPQATLAAVEKPGDPGVEDPVVKDAKVSDHNETDNDLPYEESLGEKDFISDAPFDGPSTSAAIGIGGGSGGSFHGRGGHRNLRAEGGGAKTQSAVDWALKWLAGAQEEDGGWEGPRANTGLALLAFLGAGETHRHGHHKKVVKVGLRYLKMIQAAGGKFDDDMATHAILTLAMSEAYGLTGSPLFKTSAQMGIDYLERSRVPYVGWGPRAREKICDPATMSWAAMALKSAKAAGLRTSCEAFDDIKAWADRASDKVTGRVAPGTGTLLPVSENAATAATILTRIFTGEDPRKSSAIDTQVAWCLARMPVWTDATPPDLGYLYFGSLSLFQVGGEPWKKWNRTIKEILIERQAMDPIPVKGSWEPLGPDGKTLGRVGATAIACTCLEVYYRYGRVFGTNR